MSNTIHGSEIKEKIKQIEQQMAGMNISYINTSGKLNTAKNENV